MKKWERERKEREGDELKRGKTGKRQEVVDNRVKRGISREKNFWQWWGERQEKHH